MKERIISLDVTRGISLIGILFMNALGVHYFTVFDSPFDYYQDGFSQLLYNLNIIFVQNSFYPIFAFLFGIGLSIMNKNITDKGKKSGIILYRRLFAMLIFGLIHGYFIYNGDILHTYAVMGLMLIPFLWFKRRKALITASCIWLLSFLLFLSSFNDVARKVVPFDRDPHTNHLLSSGEISAIIQWNIEEFSKVNTLLSPGNFVAAILTVSPFVLFGICAHRYDLFTKMREHQRVVLTVAIISLIIGIVIKMQSIEITGSSLAPQCLFIGGTFVAVSYYSFITLLCNKEATLKYIYPLHAVGKLGFTVYISQSIILFILFYAFRLYNTLSIGQIYIVVMMIALIQIICANIYLKHFKMGPLEWLWRKVTYLK